MEFLNTLTEVNMLIKNYLLLKLFTNRSFLNLRGNLEDFQNVYCFSRISNKINKSLQLT